MRIYKEIFHIVYNYYISHKDFMNFQKYLRYLTSNYWFKKQAKNIISLPFKISKHRIIVEYLPSMHKAMSLIPAPQRKKNQNMASEFKL
jgi:hypothetical protein